MSGAANIGFMWYMDIVTAEAPPCPLHVPRPAGARRRGTVALPPKEPARKITKCPSAGLFGKQCQLEFEAAECFQNCSPVLCTWCWLDPPPGDKHTYLDMLVRLKVDIKHIEYEMNHCSDYYYNYYYYYQIAMNITSISSYMSLRTKTQKKLLWHWYL